MKNLLFYACLILGAAAAGLWSSGALGPSAAPDKRQDKPPPDLVFDARSLDIGEVWEDRAFKHHVIIKNHGRETIRVEGISCNSCNNAVIVDEPKTFELAPGATQTVSLTINLGLSRRVELDGPRRFVTPLRLRYSTLSKPAEMQQSIGELRGAVRPVLAVAPVWNLGTHHKERRAFNRTFEVVALTPLAALEVEAPASLPLQATFSVRRRTDKSNIFDISIDSPPQANRAS